MLLNKTVIPKITQIQCQLQFCKFATTTTKGPSDYQFLQKSKLKTMYFQPSLPRLPIPKLENTCERYLAALKPILTDKAYEQSTKIVNEFRTTTGAQLQKILIDHDSSNKCTSYISEPWFEMYLKDRIPLPINYNPVLIMKYDERPEYNDQVLRAANIVVSALRFMRALRAEYLEPEVFHLNPKKSDTPMFRNIMKLAPTAFATYVAYAFKAFPLDMSQYNGLFGATRIPEIGKDRIYRNDNSKHLLVMHRGNLFTIDVLDANGNIEPPSVILSRLKQVIEKNSAVERYPLGVLTATDRNTWATVRQHLVKIGNDKLLQLIDSALFCLCLDDGTYNEEKPVPLIKDCLAGDGTNRWFDKSFSIIVAKDGTAALNFEHSWGDGVAVLRFFNEIYNETTQSPLISNSNVSFNTNDPKVNLLKLNLDDHIKEAVKNAKNAHNTVMDSLDINFLRYNDINRNLCKKSGVSPDAIMQLSFQLGFRKLCGRYVGTYESCSTAAFKHGRTETIRPCTTATKAFCEFMLKNDKPNMSESRKLIENCSTVHGNLTKEAAMGQGFDRHLFVLKYLCEKQGIKVPSLYRDTGYSTINYNILSTSTLSSPGLMAGGFGPVVKDGFGIGYTITNDLCGVLVTSYRGQRDGKEFIENLTDGFNTIRDVLCS